MYRQIRALGYSAKRIGYCLYTYTMTILIENLLAYQKNSLTSKDIQTNKYFAIRLVYIYHNVSILKQTVTVIYHFELNK